MLKFVKAVNLSEKNRSFAQLLPGLETGHPVTVSQSPAADMNRTQNSPKLRQE